MPGFTLGFEQVEVSVGAKLFRFTAGLEEFLLSGGAFLLCRELDVVGVLAFRHRAERVDLFAHLVVTGLDLLDLLVGTKQPQECFRAFDVVGTGSCGQWPVEERHVAFIDAAESSNELTPRAACFLEAVLIEQELLVVAQAEVFYGLTPVRVTVSGSRTRAGRWL